MAVYLKPIEEEDLEWARRLRNKYREGFIDQREISPEEQLLWWETYKLTPNYILYVIVNDNGEYVGTTSLTMFKNGPYELGNNIIDEDYQGKGYFSEVYHYAKRLIGGKQLFATVRPENEHMLEVYKRLGFKDIGMIEIGGVIMIEVTDIAEN